MKEETPDPEYNCKRCDTRRLIADYDPDVRARVAWLRKMEHHLKCGVSMKELGLSLDDLDEIYRNNILFDQADAERMKKEREQAEERLRARR